MLTIAALETRLQGAAIPDGIPPSMLVKHPPPEKKEMLPVDKAGTYRTEHLFQGLANKISYSCTRTMGQIVQRRPGPVVPDRVQMGPMRFVLGPHGAQMGMIWGTDGFP